MNCETCKATGILSTRPCPCCNGKKEISFHRHIQYKLGWVCWLSDDGTRDATVLEMNNRCRTIIEQEYSRYDKPGIPFIKDCDNYNASPYEVMMFYAIQFKANDTLFN